MFVFRKKCSNVLIAYSEYPQWSSFLFYFCLLSLFISFYSTLHTQGILNSCHFLKYIFGFEYLMLSFICTDAPEFIIGLLPNKPILNCKYCKSKIHLIYLTYQPYSTILKVKNSGPRECCKRCTKTKSLITVYCSSVWFVYPLDHVTDWELQFDATAQH